MLLPMPIKRARSREEIAVLAQRFHRRWVPGEPLRPWFRRHADLLLKLVHGGWSWADVAQALEQAGVKYKTDKPWTSAWLQSDFHRARIPLKRYGQRKPGQATAPVSATPVVAGNILPPKPHEQSDRMVLSEPVTLSSFYTAADGEPEPEFKFARFIDWDERRQSAHQPQAAEVKPPGGPAPESMPNQQHSQHYLEIMEQLTGKKPPY
jgi:hypothetical protein